MLTVFQGQVRFALTGFLAAFLNTLFFMSLLVLLFGQTEYLSNSMAGRGVLTYIIAATGVNALVEMIVSALPSVKRWQPRR